MDSNATIWLGGLLSPSLGLSRSTRQGCSLSPALFAIAMESVAEALWVLPLIKCLRLAWLEDKVAPYTDDRLLILNDVGPSLQGMLQVLNAFSEITGPCSPLILLLKTMRYQITNCHGWRNLPTFFEWKSHMVPLVISYLIWILFSRRQELNRKHGRTFLCPFLGHINFIKMKILPNDLFLNSPQ